MKKKFSIKESKDNFLPKVKNIISKFTENFEITFDVTVDDNVSYSLSSHNTFYEFAFDFKSNKPYESKKELLEKFAFEVWGRDARADEYYISITGRVFIGLLGDEDTDSYELSNSNMNPYDDNLQIIVELKIDLDYIQEYGFFPNKPIFLSRVYDNDYDYEQETKIFVVRDYKELDNEDFIYREVKNFVNTFDKTNVFTIEFLTDLNNLEQCSVYYKYIMEKMKEHENGK